MMNTTTCRQLMPGTGAEADVASVRYEPGELAKGAIDMHCHFGPDVQSERSVDCIEAAEGARSIGMAGLVLKSHNYCTAPVAYAVAKAVPGIAVFGGVCLNAAVGGINPSAVEVSCRTGGKVVWLPTVSSENDHRKRGYPAPGLSVFRGGRRDEAKLLPETLEVLALARDYGVVVATGHVSFPEIVAVLDAAKDLGLRKVVVTHAMEPIAGPQLNISQMQEVAERGGYLEHCALTCHGYYAEETPAVIAKAIYEVGPRHCVLSSDFGQAENSPPADGIRKFYELLLNEEVKGEDIILMAHRNPADLLEVTSA